MAKKSKTLLSNANVNIVNVSKTLLETLNATWNANENASLPNIKNLLISILTLVKMLNATQNVIAEHSLSMNVGFFLKSQKE